MQIKNRQFSAFREIKLPKEKSLNMHRIDKAKIKSLVYPISVLTFLGLWILLCYNTNLFLKEALICSSVIVGLVFLSSLDQNGDSHQRVK